jgi:hypothetical protein
VSKCPIPCAPVRTTYPCARPNLECKVDCRFGLPISLPPCPRTIHLSPLSPPLAPSALSWPAICDFGLSYPRPACSLIRHHASSYPYGLFSPRSVCFALFTPERSYALCPCASSCAVQSQKHRILYLICLLLSLSVSRFGFVYTSIIMWCMFQLLSDSEFAFICT